MDLKVRSVQEPTALPTEKRGQQRYTRSKDGVGKRNGWGSGVPPDQ